MVQNINLFCNMEFLANERVHRITWGVGQCSVASFSASSPLFTFYSLIHLLHFPIHLNPTYHKDVCSRETKFCDQSICMNPVCKKRRRILFTARVQLSLKARDLHYSVSHDCLQEHH